MSHIVTIKTQYKNEESIKEACQLLNLTYEKKLYNFIKNKPTECYLIKTPCFSKPVVINEDGYMQYDDMIDLFNNDKIITKFQNTYTLIETEKQLKKQHLKYKILSNKLDEEIKIEVTA